MQELNTRKGEKRAANPLGAAHLNPADAYRDVPILKPPTWNHEVAAYFFFGGVSAGSALIGSLAELFGGERHKQLARTAHYIAFAALLPCPPLLIDDLGYPRRFHHMLRIFKPSSPMNLGSWALMGHGAGATLLALSMLAQEGRLPFAGGLLKLLPERLLAGLGMPSSLALAGYTGVLLGTTSIPVWYTSPLLGGLFMASSLSTGAAAISLTGAVMGRNSRADHRAIGTLGVAFSSTELTLMAGYVATSGSAAKPLLNGETRSILAGAAAALLLSLALDAASLASRNNGRLLSALAGAVGLAGGAMLRWAVVSAGRKSAADREGTLQAMKPRKGSPGWWPGRGAST